MRKSSLFAQKRLTETRAYVLILCNSFFKGRNIKNLKIIKMNNKLFKIALSGLALASGSLFAADAACSSSFNPYVAIKGGFMKPAKRNAIKYKNGGMGGVELGISYDAWRLGLELSYRQSKVKSIKGKAPVKEIKFKALAGMVNVYYDYALTEEVSLYLGAGLGVAQCGYNAKGAQLTVAGLLGNNAVNTPKADITKTVFAWQVMACLGYDINENWTVEAGYKLFNTSKIKLGNGYDIKAPFCHAIELGLRYNF